MTAALLIFIINTGLHMEKFYDHVFYSEISPADADF